MPDPICTCIDLLDEADPPELRVEGKFVDQSCPVHGFDVETD